MLLVKTGELVQSVNKITNLGQKISMNCRIKIDIYRLNEEHDNGCK
jgi:hypothetical protein